MTRSEYDKRLNRLENEYEAGIKKLNLIYAKSNGPDYKIGDIVTSKNGDSILIENVCATSPSYGYPELCFIGPLLTKQLKPRKRRVTRYIHQYELQEQEIKQND